MAGFNNGFPVGYQNPWQASQQQAFPQRSGGIRWTQGIAGVQAQYVAPGTSDIFMDSECKQFYIKTVDVSGMPMPIRTFAYDEVTGAPKQDNSSYVTREEFEARLKALQAPRAKEDDGNE